MCHCCYSPPRPKSQPFITRVGDNLSLISDSPDNFIVERILYHTRSTGLRAIILINSHGFPKFYANGKPFGAILEDGLEGTLQIGNVKINAKFIYQRFARVREAALLDFESKLNSLRRSGKDRYISIVERNYLLI